MKLVYKTYGHGPPLVILHGLFGMGDNWRTFARMAEEQVTTIAVDLRNHGRSPHSDEMSYAAMADDVLELMTDLGLPSAAVMGHSMGGKVAMTLALADPARVERLIVVDMTPREYGRHHDDVIRAIGSVTGDDFQSRESVEARLTQMLDRDPAVTQFLMKNLTRLDDGSLTWKSNMPGIIAAYPQIMAAVDSIHPYEGPVAFIRGERSGYVRDEDMPMIHRLFPRATIYTIPGAGHWVHAEQPKLFAETVLDFLETNAE